MKLMDMSPGKSGADLQVEHLLGPSDSTTRKKRKDDDDDNNKKMLRRFSNEQVRSLESIFEHETKLEPKKKMEVAREVGLQPKQVAIWFQNKRARWRSKEIEKELRALRASYDTLKAQFDTLNEHRESLLLQLEELRYMVNERDEGSSRRKEVENNCSQNSDSAVRQRNQETLMLLSRDDEDMEASLEPQGRWQRSDSGSPICEHGSSQWWESWNWFTSPNTY